LPGVTHFYTLFIRNKKIAGMEESRRKVLETDLFLALRLLDGTRISSTTIRTGGIHPLNGFHRKNILE
jgi:hypothetical protein